MPANLAAKMAPSRYGAMRAKAPSHSAADEVGVRFLSIVSLANSALRSRVAVIGLSAGWSPGSLAMRAPEWDRGFDDDGAMGIALRDRCDVLQLFRRADHADAARGSPHAVYFPDLSVGRRGRQPSRIR